jgi:hypothetical protein
VVHENLPCAELFSVIPLEAVKKLIFDDGRYDLDFVLSRMIRVEILWKEEISAGVYNEMHDLMFRISPNSQEREGVLVDVLRDKCRENSEFLREFVWFVTGSHYIRQSEFKINVEFNSKENLSDNALPIVHTCENTLKFPALVYKNDREVLEQKLDLAIANSKACSFDMK